MSLVWTLIASFLYVEIAIVLLFVLPLASPTRWQRFFKSRFLEMINRQAQIYFYLLFGVLVLFLLEAIREMRKYSQTGKFQRIELPTRFDNLTGKFFIVTMARSKCWSSYECRNATQHAIVQSSEKLLHNRILDLFDIGNQTFGNVDFDTSNSTRSIGSLYATGRHYKTIFV